MPNSIPNPTTDNLPKSRVLIVDDQALMRNHMNRLLKEEGYDLFFAEDGLEAVEKVNTVLPDLILLDVRLPGIDGFEVCKRVRSNPVTADIPIIMVTAFDDRTARLRGIEAGADDFIPKPYDTLELQARVRTITRLNRYRRISNEKAKFELVAELSENGYLLINQDGRHRICQPSGASVLTNSVRERPDTSKIIYPNRRPILSTQIERRLGRLAAKTRQSSNPLSASPRNNQSTGSLVTSGHFTKSYFKWGNGVGH